MNAAISPKAQKFSERERARSAQQRAELMRLKVHQEFGAQLLRMQPAEQNIQLDVARCEVDRWEARQLCSADYIVRWREWLALPVPELVQLMLSDADGWGTAMRQNSPFTLMASAGTR